MNFEEIASNIAPQVRAALAEDIGNGDHSSMACIPAEALGKMRLLVKDRGILAGVALARLLTELHDPEIKFQELIGDGSPVQEGEIALVLEGKVHSLLSLERTLLNYMQRLSGIATHTRAHVDKIAHTSTRLLDTRKTTPGLRLLEKWAVGLGGGVNHRMGLYDAIMLKDNHIDFAGGLTKAVEAVRIYLESRRLELPLIVEVRSMDELREALALEGIDRLLIDNFRPEQLRAAVAEVEGRIPLEASGGIDLNTIAEYAETGVDFVSVGALTHRFRSLDLSLKAF